MNIQFPLQSKQSQSSPFLKMKHFPIENIGHEENNCFVMYITEEPPGKTGFEFLPLRMFAFLLRTKYQLCYLPQTKEFTPEDNICPVGGL